jgi:hypothetical protein
VVDSVVFSQEGVILNPCCLINLYASRYLSSILEALPVPVMVAADIYEHEVLRVYSEGFGEEGLIPEQIDLRSLLHAGLLVTVSPSSDRELTSVVELAAASSSDADAFTVALALHHHLAIGVDDSKAAAFFRRNAPHLQLLTTPLFVKHWIKRTDPSPETVRTALRNIERYAKYAIPPHHALYVWWRNYLES